MSERRDALAVLKEAAAWCAEESWGWKSPSRYWRAYYEVERELKRLRRLRHLRESVLAAMFAAGLFLGLAAAGIAQRLGLV